MTASLLNTLIALHQFSPLLVELVDYLAKSVFIFILVFSINKLFKELLDATTKHLLWSCLVFTIALIPLLPHVTLDGQSTANLDASIDIFSTTLLQDSSPSAATATEPKQAFLANWLPSPWLLILLPTLYLLTTLLISMLRVIVLSRQATLNTDLKLIVKIGLLRRKLNISRRVVLKFSDTVATPLSFGLIRPEIILPSNAKDLDNATLDSVLVHELSHIKRLDWLTVILAYIASSIAWFNPVLWYGLKRMRCIAEDACDDEVLRQGRSSAEYAHDLIEIAHRYKDAQELVHTQNIVAPGSFKHRIQALIQGRDAPAVQNSNRFLAIIFISGTLLCISAVVNFFNVRVGIPTFSASTMAGTFASNYQLPATGFSASITDWEDYLVEQIPRPFGTVSIPLSTDTLLGNAPVKFYVLSTKAKSSLALKTIGSENFESPVDLSSLRSELVHTSTTLEYPAYPLGVNETPRAVQTRSSGSEDADQLSKLSRSQLTSRAQEIEDDIYKIFNAGVANKELKIVCYSYTPLGSHRQRRACEPRFLIDDRNNPTLLNTQFHFSDHAIDSNKEKFIELTNAMNYEFQTNPRFNQLVIELRRINRLLAN